MTTPADSITQLVADQGVMHAWLHGPASGAGSTVSTDSGTISTPAKAVAAFVASPSVTGGVSAGGYGAPDHEFCASGAGPSLFLCRTSSGNAVMGSVCFAVDQDGSKAPCATISGAITDGSAAGRSGHLDFNTSAAGTLTRRGRFLDSGKFLVGYDSSNGSYQLQVNGQLYATSATVATSHGPYKDNQADLTGCLDLVAALTPKSFTWKTGMGEVLDTDGITVLRMAHNFPAGTQIGFIAQDVEAALEGTAFQTSIVKTNVRPAPTNAAGETVGSDETFKGLAEGNLIALLVGAVKELKARVEALEAAP